jgi:hypothetical protein
MINKNRAPYKEHDFLFVLMCGYSPPNPEDVPPYSISAIGFVLPPGLVQMIDCGAIATVRVLGC